MFWPNPPNWMQERQHKGFPKPAARGCLSAPKPFVLPAGRAACACLGWGLLQTSPRGFTGDPSRDSGFFFFFWLLHFSKEWELGRPSLAQLAEVIRHQKENNCCALRRTVSWKQASVPIFSPQLRKQKAGGCAKRQMSTGWARYTFTGRSPVSLY